MRSSFARRDFFIDKPNFLRNMWIFKKNSAMYRRKSIFQNLMSSIPLRLGKRKIPENTRRRKMQSEKARPLINLFSSGLYRRSRNFTLSRARIFLTPRRLYCRYGISPIPKDIVIIFMAAGNFSKEINPFAFNKRQRFVVFMMIFLCFIICFGKLSDSP